MCGRFTLHTVREALEQRFAIDLSAIELSARYNIAPTQPILVLVAGTSEEESGAEHRSLEARWMRWGLIPSWEPEPRTKLSTINARIENAAQSRVYRTAFRKRRCLILADGFYEWQAAAGPSRGKTPFWIHRRDRCPFAFAGLYGIWHAKGADRDAGSPADPVYSCAILTMPASPALSEIHSRMPIILRAEHERQWVRPDECDPEALAPLLQPTPGDALTAYPVSRRVNSPRNDDPALIRDAPEAGFVD